MTVNPASILNCVKKVVGVNPEDSSFDLDLVLLTNGVLSSLQQLGVGPVGGFMIADDNALWTDLTTSTLLTGQVQQYVCLKVKMAFDPPQTSFVIDSFLKLIAEFEWRIVSIAESINPPPNPDGTAGPAGITDTVISTSGLNVAWWVLTGLSDFPEGAVTGDAGVDFDTDDLYVETSAISSAYWWNLTGLSDFPDGAVVGEWGIDMSTGDVWRMTG